MLLAAVTWQKIEATCSLPWLWSAVCSSFSPQYANSNVCVCLMGYLVSLFKPATYSQAALFMLALSD